MEKYLLLADICFDWSGGEYEMSDVSNILLGVEEFESDKAAMQKAKVLLEEYCENDYSAKLYESCCSVKKV